MHRTIALFLIIIFSSLNSVFGFQSEIQQEFSNIGVNSASIKNDSIKPIISRELIHRGLVNEIDIYVPTAEKTIINNEGVKKIDNYGHYLLMLYSFENDFYELNIDSTFKNGVTKNYIVPIRIIDVKTPSLEINGKNGFQNLELEELKNAELTISMNDPLFDNYFEVESFNLYVDKKKYLVEGKIIDSKTFDIISNSKDEILDFFDVNFKFTKNSNFKICKINPLRVKLER